MANKEIEVYFNINTDALIEIENILTNIQEQLDKISKDSFGDVFSKIVNGFGSIGSIGSFVKSFIHTKKSIENEMGKIAEVISEKNKDIKKAAKTIGESLGKGIIDGIRGKQITITDTVKDMAGNIISESKHTLKINSPSKVMEAIGESVPEGLGDGIKANGKVVKNAMGDITDTVEKSAKKASKTKFSLGGIAAVATVVGTLVGYFVNMLSTNEELSGKMDKVWGKITEALSPVIDVVTSLFDSFINGGEGTSSVLDTVVEVIGGVAEFISEVISQIVGFFQENSDVIGGIIGSIWEFISGIIETAKEIFGTVIGAVVGFFQEHGDSIMGIVEGIWGFISGVAEDLMEIFSGVIEAIAGFFEEHGDEIMAVVTEIWEFISGIIEGAKEIFGGIMDVIVGIFTGNGEKIKEGFGKIWKGIKGIFSGIGEFFSGIWDKVVSIFKKVGTKIGDAISGAFKTVVNGILEFAEKVINGFIKAINFAIKMINLIPGVDIQPLELLVIPKLASGGLMEPGQMFIAREAGPELVGSFGSKTAVMNNNQIVESVSRGVYDAVRSAMGSGKGNYTFNITNTLDGREIGKQVIKYHNGVVKQTGVSPLLI